MRACTVVLPLLLCLASANHGAFAQAPNRCKACAEQQRACMKNYAGPTCKTEYQICMKSCRK